MIEPEKPPVFASWEDYIARTAEADRNARWQMIAKKANRKRLMSDAVSVKVTAQDVWEIVEAAKGRCIHCKSLCVENRPSKPNGAPAPWEHVGRRIGSLEHMQSRFAGGGNERQNLAWACLWCNTWPHQRKPLSNDYGGHYPPE